MQQTGFFQQNKPDRWFGRKDDFIQFVGNTLFGNDLNPVFVAGNGIESSLFQKKAQLRSKTNSAHHAQRVVRESNVGIEWSAYNEVFQVFQPVERVNELAEPTFIQAKRQCINGKIAAVLIVIQCSAFHYRIARIVRVGLLAGAYKFHFPLTGFYLSCAVGFEKGKLRYFAQFFMYPLGQFYSASYGNYVDILRRAMQVQITHKTTDNVGFQPHFIRRFGNSFKNFIL